MKEKTNRYQNIFGTDGVRALPGSFPLIADEIKKIGFCAGALLLQEAEKNLKNQEALKTKKILIGKDTRASCGWIEEALVCGLRESGCEPYSCGVIPTSAIAVLLQKNLFLGGVVISASHNPPEFNGIKFFAWTGKKFPDQWERKIESALNEVTQTFDAPLPLTPLNDAHSIYTQFLLAAMPSGFSLKGLRWVLDCANGSASPVAPSLFKSLGAQTTILHGEPDGKNINLNCGALHLESLRKKVVELHADGGCAFDGDADRVLFVDENGDVLDGDYLIAMMADYFKEKGALKNNAVVTTVMANYGFIQYMKKRGVDVTITPVGDRSVSLALDSTGALVGGEQSGHIIFKEFLSTGDGLLTALMVLKTLREEGKKLSDYKKLFSKFPQLLLNLKVKEKIPVEKIPAFKKMIEESELQLKDRGRVLVRYSGTEPLLRIMVEGSPLSEIKEIADRLSKSARFGVEVVSEETKIL